MTMNRFYSITKHIDILPEAIGMVYREMTFWDQLKS